MHSSDGDFDLDALLDAQSSDDDDIDIDVLELERSLDEILNDADPGDDDDDNGEDDGDEDDDDECDERGAGCVGVPQVQIGDEKNFGVNGEIGGEGLADEKGLELALVELENCGGDADELDCDVESRRSDGAEEFADDDDDDDAIRVTKDDDDDDDDDDVVGVAKEEIKGGGNLPLQDDLQSSPHSSVQSSTTELVRSSPSWEFRRRIDGFEEDGNRVSRVGGDAAEAGGMISRRLQTSSSSEFSNVLSGRTGVARGTRVGPRPGAALALAAAASRQVGRTTSVALQKSAIAEYRDSKHHLDNSDVIHDVELPTSEDNPGNSQVEVNSVDTKIGENRAYGLGDQEPGVDNSESSTGTSVQLKSNGLDESSTTARDEDGKNEERNSLNEVEKWADDPNFRSEFQPPQLSDFPEVDSSQEDTSGINLQENKEMGLLLNSCEEIQAEEEMEADIHRLDNLIGSIDKSDTTSADSSSSSSGEDEASSGMDEPSFDEDSDEAGSRSALAQQISLRRKGKHVDAALRMHKLELDAQVVEESNEKEPAHHPTPFDLAEEVEKRNASSGLHWEEGAAAQPMQLEGIQRGPPAIGLLQLESAGTLSHALSSAAMRRDHGSPQALAVHANFIAVGLSKGAVLVTPSKYSATRSADEMDPTKAVLLGGVTDKVGAAVTSLCFNQQGDLLLVGYANGVLCLWDVSRQSVTKVAEHTLAIVHTLFLGQDAPAARYFRAISGDCKGKVALHTFSQQMLPLLRRFSVTTQVLLDGPRTGTVLSVSPLLLDEEFRATGGINPAQQGGASPPPTLGSVMGGVMGGVVGGVGAVDVGRKFLYDGANSTDEGVGGMVVFVTHQTVLVVRLVPSLEVCSKLSRPTGIRDGAIAYTAWRRIRGKVGVLGSMVSNNGNADLSSASSGVVSNGHLDRGHPKEDNSNVAKDVFDNDDLPVLAMAWDKKMIIAQLTKSNLRIVREWELDTPAVGLAWLEEQMLVVVTAKDQLCLFTKEGCEVERASLGREEEGLGALTFHTHMTNSFGNPEKAHHGSLSVRGAALYLLGPSQLWRARLLPWRERIRALQDAGDWMGAFHIAMELFDGRARGVTGLPRGLDAMREAIMSTLLALLSAYIDEAFEYLSLAFAAVSVPSLDHTSGANRARQSADMGAVLDGSEHEEVVGSGQEMLEAREQYARVGGVAIEFCVHIGKQDVLFESVFSKFESVGQRGTFLELLEPYILKDMLGGLAPEVMQALVQHYSQHGWLERVEQCVLHMDIASLDFNQVVKICREHGLYSALIYLFNKGLDDFRSPLEELMTVAKQTPIASQAHLVGYKLLIYMKYCFSGLAFPPGHGSLPVTRLPGLREEILQFLLYDEVQPQMSSGIEEASLCPRLLYLLRLDTQATLVVLRFAFPEHGPLGIGKYGSAYLPDINNGDLVGVMSEDVDDGVRYVQAVVNALVEVLNVFKRDITDLSIITEKSEDIEHNWPSSEDVGSLLDFVAQFVASGHAVVESSTFMRILEYLASSSSGCKNAKVREDLMVMLLSTVPDPNMDASHILRLAQESKFWQVCALLHTRAGNHEAALDDYLRDKTRLSKPFTFITQMLDHKDGPQGSVLGNFREAVLARVPQLMQYSSMGTLWIILQHFSNENHRVIIELESCPQLLFAYMKGIMNALNSTVGGSLQWVPDVNFRDLLHRSKLEITDEMVELYVKLLCQFEPGSVFKFLESYENYRLEHCLKLCQEYGINDAAIFLLERVGDVASALALVLADLDKCQQALELSVSTFANSVAQDPLKNDAWFMNIPEVAAVKLAVAVGVALCQRNTQRLEPQESISLWFRLLDRVVEPSGRSMKADTEHGDVYDSISHSRQGSKHAGRRRATRKKSIAQGKVASRDAKGAILKKVFVLIMENIIDGMMGYVPLHYIMDKILADHGTHPFGDFRPTILNMLSAYGYERTILGTAKRIIEEDTFYNITSLRRGCTHSYAALAYTCCICGLGLDDDTNKGHTSAALGSNSHNLPKGKAGYKDTGTAIVASYGFSIFHCGHAAHITCIDGNGPSREESGCPICSLKVKSSSFSSLAKKAISKGSGSETEVGNDAPGQSKLATYLRGTANTSYYSSVTVSRLEVLKQLQDGESLSVLGPSLELHLAPPRKHRPRSAPITNSSSTSRSRPIQRTSVVARR